MKKLLFLIAATLLLTGCYKQVNIPGVGEANAGNKIVAYQDIEPTERTTFFLIRFEENSSTVSQSMVETMEEIKAIFNLEVVED